MEKPRWKRALHWIGNGIFLLVVLLALFYSVLTKYAPQRAVEWFPYQMYTVVTDSMVPTIPVNSLVIVKRADDTALQPGAIITFRANRFGDDIVLTHYLDSIEEYEGAPRYRTHAEGTDYKDDYVTRRGDILGVYVTHIPSLGKIPLFLGSVYGIVMMAFVALILLVSTFVRDRIEQADAASFGGIKLQKLSLRTDDTCCTFSGTVKNESNDCLLVLRAAFSLYDKKKKCLYRTQFSLIPPRERLEAGASVAFSHCTPYALPARTFRIELIEVDRVVKKPQPIHGRERRKS